MRAYVSYVQSDAELADRVKSTLREAGYKTDQPLNALAPDFFDSLKSSILESDVVVIILSESYRLAQYSKIDLSLVALLSSSARPKQIFSVLAEPTRIPELLRKYPVVYTNKDLAAGLAYLKKLVGASPDESDAQQLSPKGTADEISKEDIVAESSWQSTLKHELDAGNLALVCGAGISTDAKVPDWVSLLDKLIEKMVVALNKTKEFKGLVQNEHLDSVKKSSSLIIGQYLKTMLKGDFITEVQSALYVGAEESSELIDAISELAMPRRASQPLDSIITFNFDDLLERNLERKSIEYTPVFSEGQRVTASTLPIFHVHGYLPKGEKIEESRQIVFAEDAYHDQFIDPFSWSNLIQLSKYAQKTCLFLGVSLSDPNLRRLLDVARRKSLDEENRHYIIFKKSGTSTSERVIDSLKETDAAGLGLQVIWIDQYPEVAEILRSLRRA